MVVIMALKNPKWHVKFTQNISFEFSRQNSFVHIFFNRDFLIGFQTL